MGSSRVLPATTERERVLLAVAEVWMESGYEELRGEEIAARAGIGAERFTRLFPDVEAAAQAALEVPFSGVVGLVGEQFAPDRSEPESCAMGIVAILEFMAANPAYAYVTYLGRRQGVPPGVKALAKTAQRFVVVMLERLRESSGLHGQPAVVGVGALGAPEALIRREILAGRVADLPSLAPAVIYSAMAPFVGQEEALRLARECGP